MPGRPAIGPSRTEAAALLPDPTAAGAKYGLAKLIELSLLRSRLAEHRPEAPWAPIAEYREPTSGKRVATEFPTVKVP